VLANLSPMLALKKILHTIVIAISKVASKFLPDRTPVTFVGESSSFQLCRAIGDRGFKKVLIVTDAGLVAIGLIDRITDALRSAGIEWSIYDGVLPDPTTKQVDSGLAQLKRDQCEAVLAVGGGSPMDASKVIAAMATNDKSVAKLEGLFKVRTAPMALFAIPTTAGTGSEVTVAAVISDDETHTKKFIIDHKLLPEMTALDPTLMTGLPPHITAATGMDALTHAVESYLSVVSTPQTASYAKAAVRIVFENLPLAYRDGENLEARQAMALASYYAGYAFTRTSVGYVHAIAHTFGAYYGTPHGLANAIALPHVLEFSVGPAESRMADLATVIGITEGSQAAKAQQFIERVKDLMAKVSIPEKLDALQQQDIPAIARQATTEAFLNYPVPRFMSEAECETVLGRILS
jgi:alcohol dehydrogenase